MKSLRVPRELGLMDALINNSWKMEMSLWRPSVNGYLVIVGQGDHIY